MKFKIGITILLFLILPQIVLANNVTCDELQDEINNLRNITQELNNTINNLQNSTKELAYCEIERDNCIANVEQKAGELETEKNKLTGCVNYRGELEMQISNKTAKISELYDDIDEMEEAGNNNVLMAIGATGIICYIFLRKETVKEKIFGKTGEPRFGF